MENPLRPAEEPFSAEIQMLLEGVPRQNGYLLKLFRVFANSPRFLKKGVSNHLDKQSPISKREREIVILRVTANLECEYEWGVHVAIFSRHVGLTEEQVRATVQCASTASCWSEPESLLLEVVDQMCLQGYLDQEELNRFQEMWTVEQQLEILAVCGTYHTVSYVANVSGIDLESFSAKFPRSVSSC
ncbi:carboxymuconolactone decarboxylase family protein [Leisingera methylohalidivorans]|uniref:Carboxymuconolactone decarboxylase n=1 Tax=Leisingera methylohalidivorans DSM 14336 TaxID=999552 RepID=V9VZG0_9RHOB|nr:carboxymuconolactone decarboxylase family protein [Leisingera methylohalidivorans]AHD02262.1 carboxymuconolactone decarboxylase [Leisingera methylohalidivorans DSM 14336]